MINDFGKIIPGAKKDSYTSKKEEKKSRKVSLAKLFEDKGEEYALYVKLLMMFNGCGASNLTINMVDKNSVLEESFLAKHVQEGETILDMLAREIKSIEEYLEADIVTTCLGLGKCQFEPIMNNISILCKGGYCYIYDCRKTKKKHRVMSIVPSMSLEKTLEIYKRSAEINPKILKSSYSVNGKGVVTSKVLDPFNISLHYANKQKALEDKATYDILTYFLDRYQTLVKEPCLYDLTTAIKVDPPAPNITPEEFLEQYKPKGVQFGNYTTKREEWLGELARGLDVLSTILDIPKEKLLMASTLGVALGARGNGGANSAMAHYEPKQCVINLTKNSGRGCFAHEYGHAIDHILGSEEASQHEVFTSKKIEEDILTLKEYKQRGAYWDNFRSKPYWAKPNEMWARAFEQYIKNEATRLGLPHEFLVSFKEQTGEEHSLFLTPKEYLEFKPTIVKTIKKFKTILELLYLK